METSRQFEFSALEYAWDHTFEYDRRGLRRNIATTVSNNKLYSIHLADAFTWLAERAENSIHAIVTDPPYGLKEYTDIEKSKLRNGRGGIWRIPPSFDGCKRSPLPGFTVLDAAD